MKMDVIVEDGQAALDAILASFTETPAFTPEQLEGSFWRLFDISGRLLSPFMVLAPQGLVGNPGTGAVDLWQIVNGQLCFTAGNGTPSVIFKHVRRDEEGRIINFAGRGIIDGVEALYLLRAVEHPEHPLYATPASAPRSATFLKQKPAGTLRPNLVVLPAGPESLHDRWFEDFSTMPLTRNWDLCIGWYGQDRPDMGMECDYLAHIPQTKKFRLIHDLFHADSPLWNYEAIWLPDDDLLATGNGINRMFHLFRKFGLDLGQPSLLEGEDCFPNHPVTIRRAGSDVRYEPFVEIMCPVFSRRALKICIGSMRDVESGYGLDHLWPAFLGHPRGRMGIIDGSAVIHTRPIGFSYDIRRAIHEQQEVWKAYNHSMRRIDGVV